MVNSEDSALVQEKNSGNTYFLHNNRKYQPSIQLGLVGDLFDRVLQISNLLLCIAEFHLSEVVLPHLFEAEPFIVRWPRGEIEAVVAVV